VSSGIDSGDGARPIFLQTGIGIADAKTLTRDVVNANAAGLISIGTAGGLDPELSPGALLVPHGIQRKDGKKFLVDTEWHARVLTALEKSAKVYTEDMFTVNRVIASPAEKISLNRKTKAIGVDMESAGLAEIAAIAGIPFLVLRVVMDTAVDQIPKAATVSVNAAGETSTIALLGYLAGHLSDVPGLIRTLRQYRSAAASLREACRLARNELLCPP
jgi:adenosylhomocysteine nucleosidase